MNELAAGLLQGLDKLLHGEAREYPQALVLAEQLENAADTRELKARALYHQGEALENMGRFQEAEERLNRAMTLAERARDNATQLLIADVLGKVNYTLGQTNAALRCWSRGLELALDEGSLAAYINFYVGIGGIYMLYGMHEESLHHHLSALEYSQELDDPRLRLKLHIWLASDYNQLGRHAEALQQLGHSREIAAGLPAGSERTEIGLHSGNAWWGLRNLEHAAQSYQDTILLAHRYSSMWCLSPCLLGLARIRREQGQSDVALKLAREALQAAEQNAAPFQEQQSLALLSSIEEELGLGEDALAHYEAHTELNLRMARDRNLNQLESSTLRKIRRMETRMQLLKTEQERQKLQEESIRQQAAHLAEKQSLLAINQAKSDFLAMISHEIRTPLTGVIGMLRLALKQPELAATTRGQLDTGLESAELLLDIINDILDTSKIEAGKLVLEDIPFDLHRLIGQVTGLLHGRARGKGLDFRVEIRHLPQQTYLGDPTRLRQILFNLIGNAIKFTDQGHVTLTVWYEAPLLKFTVADSGIGMDADTRSRLFRKFEQADSSTTRRFGGTGLGLAICHGLVQLMQGGIAVTSAPGEGTTFRVDIPLAIIDTAPDEAQHGEAPQQLSHQLKVLYAEDVPTNQQLVQALLNEMGMDIVLVDDGQQALEALAREDYDVALMDWRMPVMDGMTAIRHLRRGGLPDVRVRDPDLYVIALTANASEREQEAGAHAGLNEYLLKPIDPQALQSALQRAIRYQLARGKTLPPLIRHSPALTGKSEQAPWLMHLADAGVDIAAALPRLNFNNARLNNWLRQFFREQQALMDRLAAGEPPGQPLLERVHAMRGVAGTLGLNELFHLATGLEQALRRQDADIDYHPLLAAFAGLRERVLAALPDSSPAARPPARGRQLQRLPDALADEVAALQQALDNNSLRARRLLETLLLHAPETRNLLAPLDQALARLDYPAARAALAALTSPEENRP
ncbi:ATP-binding protein [Chitinilyticum litopenaei]|uniref:ATP-binding protein n=1 Tax=Chitinilyticum litopenaei TaxID=1121276 RepID=UPI00041628E7|nr:ATP-binding protein [Chitinilyticum litopenaei]